VLVASRHAFACNHVKRLGGGRHRGSGQGLAGTQPGKAHEQIGARGRIWSVEVAAEVEFHDASRAVTGAAHGHGRWHGGDLRVRGLGVLENSPPARERCFARRVEDVVGRHAAEGRWPQGSISGGELVMRAAMKKKRKKIERHNYQVKKLQAVKLRDRIISIQTKPTRRRLAR